MKRQTYFQVHKNKNPKRLKKKKPNLLALKTVLTLMQSVVQCSIISSQSINTFANKVISLSNVVINCAEQISNLNKEHKAKKYLSRNVAS